jgi:tRNA (guanine26-N2/guanine27-N2)-dimethyltransferase
MKKALHENQIRTLTERLRLSLNEDVKKLDCSMLKMIANATMSNNIKIVIRNGDTDDGSDRMNMKRERGVRFVVGDSFFREESRNGRDLGVLAAALHKKRFGKLRVLDAMCGCGVRALRYLVEANADFVWANDANDHTRPTILSNLSQIQQQDDYEDHENNNMGRRKWVISHSDANRVMVERYLQGDYYDLIDVDSFGSDSFFLGSAFSAIHYGGLLYLTSTDGVSSGGHRPYK